MGDVFVRVALDHPIPTLFDYRCPIQPLPQVGQMVQVPFGKRSVAGLVCEVTHASDVPAERLRNVQAYGLLPFALSDEDILRMHADDERIPVDSFRKGVDFLYAIVSDFAANK